MKFKLKKLALGLGILGVMTKIFALDQFVIKNIRVDGLQRIEIGTVFSYLPVRVGDTMNDAKADDVIQRLYATGFFKDVRVENQGNTLIIDVSERSVISELNISGDHAFDHDKLVKSLQDNGLSDGKIFDQSVLDQAVLSLKSEYYNRGLYSVSIDPQVVQLSRNRVAINIAISEGRVAKIAEIDFIGNKAFSQRKLRSQMFLTTGNLLSWWYKDNQYSNDKLSGDIETVRTFYLNQGYINFKINSVQVQLSPDKTSVYITINVNEGKQYKIKDILLSGDTKNVPLQQLKPLTTSLHSGDIVNQAAVNKVVESLKGKLGDYGYAFANVNPVPKLDDDKHTVSYTFFIDTNKKVYVRRIDITGNEKTRDTVIRRELRQNEDALYNNTAIERSKNRLNLLGYFKDTDVTTTPVPGSNDQVDMNVKVTENDTGSIRFGVGYAQSQGILLNGSISQSNLFGSGKAASLYASTSALNQMIGLSFNDPYYFVNGTSLGYDLLYNIYTPDQVGISPYETKTISFRAKSSIPVSEYDRINFSLGAENNQITLSGANVPLRFYQFTNVYGNSVPGIPFSVGWVRNTTDSMLWPTRGAIFNEVADMTLPGVGATYYDFSSTNTWFFPITDNLTWKTKAELGYINAYGSSSIVPFYKNYYAGGPGSIRGFALGSLGPKDTDGTTFGGTQKVIFSNEIMIPLPGIKDSRVARIGAFFDAGSLWGGNNFNLTAQQSFRASYGLSLYWVSPLGTMGFSYAIPLFTQPNDNIQNFQYTLGSSF